ncbi:hypothetical protein [Streptomyces sp. WAC01280]|uniref:hypothetical protein n=1 Tax=Streptomyces sp. WAC01280 TaxID=2487424 RepID=UPI000F781427|nr:hypothetical protein [Streptomyces sp. WAC01280]RSS59560.1 hypothetical protein EF909_06695 [Streptomyces sp. WAC01280]
MTTTPTTLPDHALTAAADLRATREQWGDLLDAIGNRPAAQWPPVDNIREVLATIDDEPSVGRAPLTLRQHPAPVNLDALDAALDVERALFAACDTLATRYQRPVRRRLVTLRSIPPRTIEREDQGDRADPNRWTPVTTAGATLAPGSRRFGLHWAAVWLEARALGEQHDDLFAPLDTGTVTELAAVTRQARRRIERALARAGRRTDLLDPCPWCAGTLLARTLPGDEPSVTCQTGEPCTAPVALDRGRRTWRGSDLAALWAGLNRQREAA